MKRFFLSTLVMLVLVLNASAYVITNIYTSGFANSGYIPDDNFSGWTDTRTVSGNTGLTVANVQVTLDVVSGWNGDLYGYLVHDTGFVVLLDRVGKDGLNPFGFGNAGFTAVTLWDGQGHSLIQTNGTYGASSPLSTGNYTSSDGTLHTAFDGLAVDGSWSLFLADLSSGDISQITGWTLTITAVPEPTTWAILIFGTVFGGVRYASWRKGRA
jgi:hypothetical protein